MKIDFQFLSGLMEICDKRWTGTAKCGEQTHERTHILIRHTTYDVKTRTKENILFFPCIFQLNQYQFSVHIGRANENVNNAQSDYVWCTKMCKNGFVSYFFLAFSSVFAEKFKAPREIGFHDEKLNKALIARITGEMPKCNIVQMEIMQQCTVSCSHVKAST